MTLVAMTAACTDGASTSTTASMDGKFFSKKKQTTIAIHDSNESGFLMDTTSLTGETKNVQMKKMTDAEIASFFANSNSEIKAGDYYASVGEECSVVFVKYVGDADGYVANCMLTTPTRYVKE